MKIRRFNESKEGGDIFSNKDKLLNSLGRISNMNLSIHYKAFNFVEVFGEKRPWPFSSQTKIGFDDESWLNQNFGGDIESGKKLEINEVRSRFDKLLKKGFIIRGIIIDIEDRLGTHLTSDEGRGGREFYKMSLDFTALMEDIDNLKESFHDEGYTLSMYISTNRNGASNFSSNAMISLLILDGDF
jgi:hypothetical protein